MENGACRSKYSLIVQYTLGNIVEKLESVFIFTLLFPKDVESVDNETLTDSC